MQKMQNLLLHIFALIILLPGTQAFAASSGSGVKVLVVRKRIKDLKEVVQWLEEFSKAVKSNSKTLQSLQGQKILPKDMSVLKAGIEGFINHLASFSRRFTLYGDHGEKQAELHKEVLSLTKAFIGRLENQPEIHDCEKLYSFCSSSLFEQK